MPGINQKSNDEILTSGGSAPQDEPKDFPSNNIRNIVMGAVALAVMIVLALLFGRK